MCFSQPRATVSRRAPSPPPPPEPAPAAIETAVEAPATGLTKKRRGAKSSLGRKSSGAQYAGSGSGTGLKIK